MADTAAFFAKKKKKKKAFKFNANNIDVSKAISTVHIDAPAVSSEMDNTSTSLSSLSIKEPKMIGGDWDDNDTSQQQKKQPSTATISSNTGNGSGPAELLDMKALDKKRNEQDDIAERMRVEENKAKLAAAKAGMEKEALRIKEEQEMKKSQKEANNVAAMPTGDRKWVPSHLRQASRQPVSSSSGVFRGRKVDMGDENLFPDLATADKMIAKEEQEKLAAAAAIEAAKATKKSKKLVNKDEKLEPEKEKIDKEAKEASKNDEAAAAAPTPEPKAVATPAPATTSAPSSAVGAGLIKKKKKKKKDLSTFKASS